MAPPAAENPPNVLELPSDPEKDFRLIQRGTERIEDKVERIHETVVPGQPSKEISPSPVPPPPAALARRHRPSAFPQFLLIVGVGIVGAVVLSRVAAAAAVARGSRPSSASAKAPTVVHNHQHVHNYEAPVYPVTYTNMPVPGPRGYAGELGERGLPGDPGRAGRDGVRVIERHTERTREVVYRDKKPKRSAAKGLFGVGVKALRSRK